MTAQKLKELVHGELKAISDCAGRCLVAIPKKNRKARKLVVEIRNITLIALSNLTTEAENEQRQWDEI